MDNKIASNVPSSAAALLRQHEPVIRKYLTK